jgi:hypothetical protein
MKRTTLLMVLFAALTILMTTGVYATDAIWQYNTNLALYIPFNSSDGCNDIAEGFNGVATNVVCGTDTRYFPGGSTILNRTDDYITVPDIMYRNWTNMTIAFWTYIGEQAGTQQGLIGNSIWQKKDGFYLPLYKSGTTSFLDFSVGNNSANYQNVIAHFGSNYINASRAIKNRWIHVAGVFNEDEYIQIYINGLLMQNKSLDASRPNPVVDKSRSLLIGKWDTNNFNGSFYKLAIWNRTLSPTEIYKIAISEPPTDTNITITLNLTSAIKISNFSYGIQEKEMAAHYWNNSQFINNHKSAANGYERIWLFDRMSSTMRVHSIPLKDDCTTYDYTNLTYLVQLALNNSLTPLISFAMSPGCIQDGLKKEGKGPNNFTKFVDYELNVTRYLHQSCINGVLVNCGDFSSWWFEVWNEPNMNSSFWFTNKANYSRLFNMTSKRLKEYYPNIKVGTSHIDSTATKIEDFYGNISTTEYPYFFGYHLYSDSYYKANPSDSRWDGYTFEHEQFSDWFILYYRWYRATTIDPSVFLFNGEVSINAMYNPGSQFLLGIEGGSWMASALYYQLQTELIGDAYFQGTNSPAEVETFGLWYNNGTNKSSMTVRHNFLQHFMKGKKLYVGAVENNNPFVQSLATDDDLVLINKQRNPINLTITINKPLRYVIDDDANVYYLTKNQFTTNLTGYEVKFFDLYQELSCISPKNVSSLSSTTATFTTSRTAIPLETITLYYSTSPTFTTSSTNIFSTATLSRTLNSGTYFWYVNASGADGWMTCSNASRTNPLVFYFTESAAAILKNNVLLGGASAWADLASQFGLYAIALLVMVILGAVTAVIMFQREGSLEGLGQNVSGTIMLIIAMFVLTIITVVIGVVIAALAG